MTRMEDEIDAGRIVLSGDEALISTLAGWMQKSRFAVV